MILHPSQMPSAKSERRTPNHLHNYRQRRYRTITITTTATITIATTMIPSVEAETLDTLVLLHLIVVSNLYPHTPKINADGNQENAG